MVNERMLELSILLRIHTRPFIKTNSIDRHKLYEWYMELMEEFLKPYVIDNAEKSE